MSSTAKYISQDPGENNCGAFALAYYIWEASDSEHIVNSVEDKAFVQDIYTKIKFDKNSYSSPKKMIDYLTENKKVAVLRANENLEEKQEYYSGLLDGCAVDFQSGDFINALENGQYAIIICQTEKSRALHYIMIRKQANGCFTVIDPNNGVVQKDQTIKAGACVGNSMWIYLGAALVISTIK